MDCRTDCPFLIKSAETQRSLLASRDEMTAAQNQLDENEAQNTASAQSLLKLPFDNPDRVSATAALQDAVIGVGEARSQIAESLELITVALEANHHADQTVQNACPGEPIEVNDVARPGNMVIACAALL